MWYKLRQELRIHAWPLFWHPILLRVLSSLSEPFPCCYTLFQEHSAQLQCYSLIHQNLLWIRLVSFWYYRIFGLQQTFYFFGLIISFTNFNKFISDLFDNLYILILLNVFLSNVLYKMFLVTLFRFVFFFLFVHSARCFQPSEVLHRDRSSSVCFHNEHWPISNDISHIILCS